MNSPVDKIKSSFHDFCAAIGARESFHTVACHDGSAHIEIVDGKFNYVVTELGHELVRRATESDDEILYWLMSDVVFGLACRYELENRVRGQSFRRLLFAREVELMEKLNPAWADRKRQEIDDILSRHPFNDLVEG